MAKNLVLVLVIAVLSFGCCQSEAGSIFEAKPEYRRITVEDYVSKMKAGWLGQLAGVGWGERTEFKFRSEIIPDDKVPVWKPELINQFDQDDMYLEMSSLRTLEKYGLDVSIRQVGIDFANTTFRCWSASAAVRESLRRGLAPPDCGHPRFNKSADSIDYQIEADFSGLISPGLPTMVIELGEKFGRLKNYGDGLYAGRFVGAMYSEAFFETDMKKIILAGLKCVPKGSQYYEAITDVLKWHKKYPDDWQKTRQLVHEKYSQPAYRRFSSAGAPKLRRKPDYNIDAKINGAYAVIGMLYGGGDIDKTIVVSMRCGQDSDCNPSTAAGVLFTTMGLDKIPDRFTSALDTETKFEDSVYNFDSMTKVCEQLARQVVVKAGGRIEKDAGGKEVFVIPVQKPKAGKLQQCWDITGPINSAFTEEERAQITEKPFWNLRKPKKKK